MILSHPEPSADRQQDDSEGDASVLDVDQRCFRILPPESTRAHAWPSVERAGSAYAGSSDIVASANCLLGHEGQPWPLRCQHHSRPDEALMIPTLDTATGLLPPGRHRACWSEIESVFVRQAPHSAERHLLFRRLRDWADQCWSMLPKAELWVDGSFVRYDESKPPFDIDVVAFVDPPDLAVVTARAHAEIRAAEQARRRGGPSLKCPFAMRFYSLWTMGEVGSGSMTIPRLQPFGSAIDGFFAPTDPGARGTWHDTWSGIAMGAPEKGYLEVMPDA